MPKLFNLLIKINFSPKVTVVPFGAVNALSPDLSHLAKQPIQPEVPNFVKQLGKLKHVKAGLNAVEPEKEHGKDPVGQNFGSIWSKDELNDEETMYDKDRPIPPKFKTHFKAQLNLRERDTAHYEAKLIPIGDPTMKIEWLRNGEPLRSAARYEIKYDFGFVSLNLLWTYPEDDGIYECVATNAVGQDKTRAELKCKVSKNNQKKYKINVVVYKFNLTFNLMFIYNIKFKKKLDRVVM